MFKTALSIMSSFQNSWPGIVSEIARQCAGLNRHEAEDERALRELRRHSSAIRTGCADQRPDGSGEGGSQHTGTPTAIQFEAT
jgi:hypothetical protein